MCVDIYMCVCVCVFAHSLLALCVHMSVTL